MVNELRRKYLSVFLVECGDVCWNAVSVYASIDIVLRLRNMISVLFVVVIIIVLSVVNNRSV